MFVIGYGSHGGQLSHMLDWDSRTCDEHGSGRAVQEPCTVQRSFTVNHQHGDFLGAAPVQEMWSSVKNANAAGGACHWSVKHRIAFERASEDSIFTRCASRITFPCRIPSQLGVQQVYNKKPRSTREFGTCSREDTLTLCLFL